MVLLDEVADVPENDGESLGPGLLVIITLLENTVGVELSGFLHLGDVGGRLGGL